MNDTPETEQTEQPETEEKELTPKEDLRAALEKAWAEHNGDEEKESAEPKEEPKAAGAPEEKPIEAPSEWNAEEKEDFKALSRKQQEAALRIYSSRQREFGQFRQDRKRFEDESAEFRDLVKTVTPFIKATGEQGKTAAQAVQEAVAIVQKIRANPELYKTVKDGLTAAANGQGGKDAKPVENTATIERINGVEQKLDSFLKNIEVSRLGGVFSEVQAEKNGAGAPRFPDMNDTQSGLELARKVGSLFRSQEFRAAVMSRMPNASERDMLIEAYRWHGGRVDDSAKSQTPQEHINRASRAAASVPGRSRGNASSNPHKKYKTIGEALRAAARDNDWS